MPFHSPHVQIQYNLVSQHGNQLLLPHEQIAVQIFYIASRLKVTPSKSIPLNIFLPICSPSVRHSHKRSESFTGVGRNQQSRYEFQVDGADSPEPPPLEILDHVRRPIIWTQISPVTCGSEDCQAYGCHLFSFFQAANEGGDLDFLEIRTLHLRGLYKMRVQLST